MSTPSTLGSINLLPEAEKRQYYTRMIPLALLGRFHLNPYLIDKHGNDLLHLHSPPGSSSAEISLYHRHDFPDPILYGHLTDTMNGQIHILLYVLNDPDSQRFDIDRLPDGTLTQLGAESRHLEAEMAALEAGLSPGQIRSGLHMLRAAQTTFEAFVDILGHDIHFAEPLYYHNAMIFEHYGFAYQQGRRMMERIERGFSLNGGLLPLLDNSTPFRKPEAAQSIRLRSWAIHDGILGEPFTNVTMYKHTGKNAGVSTCPQCNW